jgi:hypothetical protein
MNSLLMYDMQSVWLHLGPAGEPVIAMKRFHMKKRLWRKEERAAFTVDSTPVPIDYDGHK